MDNRCDEAADPDPSDQGEPSHDAGIEVEKQGDREKQDKRDFQEQWDELVRTYLSALEKAETKVQSDQYARPFGNHLFSSFNEGEAIAAPIGQQVPLSRLMRHRWDEEKAAFALTTSSAQKCLLDKFFWEYLDDLYWGDNTVGGHEGMVDLFNAPSRMLMDWFVRRRVEERQRWDPKALLDQVLRQMDGKPSAWTL